MDKKHKLGIKCPTCQDVIYSNFRHDFKFCGCGRNFVDGGNDYLRYGGEDFPNILIVDQDGKEVKDEVN